MAGLYRAAAAINIDVKVIEIYREEIASITNTHERQAARRYWLRAVIETLQERSLTSMPLPSRKAKADTVERFIPYWHGLPDSDLYALFDYLTPFFRRRENRGLKL